MNLLRQFATCTGALVTTALWAPSALAANCARADASLAGHDVMRGMMEVGSELRLQANGSFDYMLAYGALDEFASRSRCTWSGNFAEGRAALTNRLL